MLNLNKCPRMQRHSRPCRARGSVLIVVVVSIVLLTVLGAVYLQVAQVQRAVAAKPIDNIDTILASVVQEIQIQLGEDVFTGSDLFRNNTVESYDYPWTDQTAGTTTYTDPITGTNYTVLAATTDDRWLSSTTPGFGSGIVWPHITALNELYIVSSGSDPADLTSGHTYAEVHATPPNENVNASVLVDADGDGIGDSQWQRAPIPLMTGVDYFMAVRIIDASALTSDGDNNRGAASNPIRGYYPQSIDLSRLTSKRSSANWASEVQAFFGTTAGGLRGTTLGNALPTPVGVGATITPGSRADNFENGTAIYHQFFAKDGPDAKATLNLQYRGGTDNPTASIYNGPLTTLLNASTYIDTDGPGPDEPVADGQAQAFFVGGAAAPSSKAYLGIRHMVTGVSGQAVFAPNIGNTHSGTYRLRTDLNHHDPAATGTTDAEKLANGLRDRYALIFALGGGLGSRSADVAAVDAAVATQAYQDEDSKPSVGLTQGADTYYGLETLPFLREAYIEAGYTDTEENATGSANPDTWVFNTGSQALMVELGNPFDRPIVFGDGSGGETGPEVRIRVAGTTDWTYQLVGTLGSREEFIVYADAATAVTEAPSTGDLGDDILASFTKTAAGTLSSASALSNLAIDATTVAGSPDFAVTGELGTSDTGAAIDIAGTPVVIELQVNAGGTWVTYDRLTDDAFEVRQKYPHHNIATVPNGVTTRHAQKALARDGQNIRYVSNRGKAVHQVRLPDEDNSTYSTTTDTFETDTKGISGDGSLDAMQFPIANRQVFSVAELGWIAVLGFHDGTTGDFPQRLSGADGTSGILGTAGESLFLPFTGNIASTGMSYGQLVMDQFTTVSPRFDGKDNNNDTVTDDAAEQFVFGTCNINTMPEHLIAHALPLPATETEADALASALVTARGTADGFDSLGRLVPVLNANVPSSMTTAATMGDYNLYPQLENLAPAGQLAIDYDDTGGTATTIDTPEERVRLIQFLTQAISTRSDVYIAHIFVAGFRDNDTDSTYDELIESGRMIVVFSRANMTSGDDTPEVLASYRY